MELVQTSISLSELKVMGSEVERAMKWSSRGRVDRSANAFFRGPEPMVDYFMGENKFESADASWQRYLHASRMAAARERERRLAS